VGTLLPDLPALQDALAAKLASLQKDDVFEREQIEDILLKIRNEDELGSGVHSPTGGAGGAAVHHHHPAGGGGAAANGLLLPPPSPATASEAS
jgi:hypothetical protein